MTNAASQEAGQAMPGASQASLNAPAQAQSKPEAPRVDMLAAARDAQWSADTFLGVGSIKLVAPAKVNLFLGVGARRADGYHDVTNIMHAVALHDVLHVHCAPAAQADFPEACADAELPAHLAWGGPANNLLVSIDCSDKAAAVTNSEPLSIPTSENIVFKAFDRLACAIGREEREMVSVHIEKHVPHQGGLGGGSSDAAAALVAAAHFWGLDPTGADVASVAQSLGSDVAFFLHGGCALFSGAGEVFDHALSPRKDSVVLVKPQVGVSTPAAYRAFDEAPVAISDQELLDASSAQNAKDVPLFNNLAPAACALASELAEVRAWLTSQPGVASESDVLLCGSGATTFAITQSAATAGDIAAAARARGWWARATNFSSLRAAQVPRR